MAIDYGSAKIGISLSDPLKIIARDYTVLFQKEYDDILVPLNDIIQKESVDLIVLGLPINMDGSHGFQADEVMEFKNKLETLNILVVLNDERLTTKMAEETMQELKMSKEDIIKKSDAKAASFILQNYLDYN
jgi:putative Holliday junction resolvase